MIPSFQLGAIGIPITLEIYRLDGTLETNLGSSTNRKVYLYPPSGTVKEKTATLIDGGSTGRMMYLTTSADDLDELGTWNVQGRFSLAGGDHPTTVASFNVLKNLF